MAGGPETGRTRSSTALSPATMTRSWSGYSDHDAASEPPDPKPVLIGPVDISTQADAHRDIDIARNALRTTVSPDEYAVKAAPNTGIPNTYTYVAGH
jgi:hypothetical protein